MKSAIKIYKDDLSDFYAFLNSIEGCEVNTEVVDWRVLMFRLAPEAQWTQAYDGLTRNAKVERDFVRVFGPNAHLVHEFYKGSKAA